jgi:hypothetical protein
MKFSFLSSFILLFAITNGQTTITGKWKIVSIDKPDLYYNCMNDSMSFKERSAGLPDTTAQKNTAQTIKATLCSFQFIFKSNSKFKFIADSILMVAEGNYQVFPAKKIIQFSNKRSSGLNDFDLPDKISYLIKDGLLYLSMDGNDEEFEIILKKDE